MSEDYDASEQTELEQRYVEVRDELPDDIRNEIAEQYALKRDGKRNQYGHDLWGAIQKGWINKARKLIGQAMDAHAKRDCVYSDRGALSLTIMSLIEVAAERGLTADQIRKELQDALAHKDHWQIEKIVQRHGKSA